MRLVSNTLLLLLLFAFNATAQFNKPPQGIIDKAPEWAQLMYSENPNYFEVQQAFREYYRGKTVKKNMHTRNLKFFRRLVQYRLRADGSIVPTTDKVYQERIAKAHEKQSLRNAAGNWSLIGPIQSLNSEGTPSADQACVYCIDQALSDPNILFCGTEPGEIYKSTDGGENWTNVSLNYVHPFAESAVRAIAIHPTNTDIVYFSTQDRLFRSTDGGNNWNLLTTLDGFGAEKIVIHPTQSNILLIATREGLYRSTDSGSNWVTVFDNPTYDIELNTADDNIVYALRKNQDLPEFLISTDFGENFSKQNDGWYTSSNSSREFEVGRIAVTSADSDRIYAYLMGQAKEGDYGYIGVYRSDDGGNSWILPNGPVGGPFSDEHPNLASADGFGESEDNIVADGSFCALAVSSSDPDQILIGGLNLWRSDDGGATFEPLGGYIGGLFDDASNTNGFHVDQQEYKVYGNTTWLTTDGGIYKSTDFFSSLGYEKKNRGVHSTDFWGFGSGWNQDVLIGGVFHNGVLAYNETYGEGTYVSVGFAGEPSSGYVNPGENNLVYATDVGGAYISDEIGPIIEFSEEFIPNESFDPLDEGYSDYVFHPQCYSVAFTGFENGLWRSIDKGLSFQKLQNFGSNSDDFITYIHISRSNPDIMYLCQRLEANNKAKLWKSEDAAESWSEINIPSDVAKFMLLQVDPFDPSNIWIASSTFDEPSTIYQSEDGGNSWNNISSPTIADEYAKTLDYIPGTNGGLYLGTNLGIYYKDAAMNDWMDFSDGLPAVSTAQKSRPFYRDNKLRISSTKGMWESELMERPDQAFAQIMVDRIETCAEAGTSFSFVDYSILQHEGATWEWTFEGGTPSTASTWLADVTFNTAGTHQVTLKITDNRGLVSTDVMEINIGGTAPSIDILFDQEDCESLSTDGLESEYSALSLSPNPTSGQFDLHYQTTSQEQVTMKLFDASGKVVFKQGLQAPIGNVIQQSFNINHLPKGTYWIKLENSEEIRVEKIILIN